MRSNPWQYAAAEECHRFLVNEWTNENLSKYLIGTGGLNFALLEPTGQYACFGIGSWSYATEVKRGEMPSGDLWRLNDVYTGEIQEKRLDTVPSTVKCLEIMNELVANSSGPNGTIFRKTIVSENGARKEMFYKVHHSQGPYRQACNATIEGTRVNMDKYLISNVLNGRKVTYAISPTWDQYIKLLSGN